jgi:hypothetical protein
MNRHNRNRYVLILVKFAIFRRLDSTKYESPERKERCQVVEKSLSSFAFRFFHPSFRSIPFYIGSRQPARIPRPTRRSLLLPYIDARVPESIGVSSELARKPRGDVLVDAPPYRLGGLHSVTVAGPARRRRGRRRRRAPSSIQFAGGDPHDSILLLHRPIAISFGERER